MLLLFLFIVGGHDEPRGESPAMPARVTLRKDFYNLEILVDFALIEGAGFQGFFLQIKKALPTEKRATPLIVNRIVPQATPPEKSA